jgi:hypothetical protein
MYGMYFLKMLDSSVLHYAAYRTVGGMLELGFRRGKVYRYHGVPLQVAVDLVTARSAGQYYNQFIRSEFAPVDNR